MNSAVPSGYRHDPHDADLFILRCPDCGHEERKDRRTSKEGRRCTPCGRLMGVTPVSKRPSEAPGESGQRVLTDGGREIVGPNDDPATPEHECANCGAAYYNCGAALECCSDLARTDGGLYACETPDCDGEKEVVTSEGYLCQDCADDLADEYDDGRLLADGGQLQTRDESDDVDDRIDPEDLIDRRTPAYVQVTGQGLVYVADYSILDSGWVRLTEWRDERVKLPPSRVDAIREVPTEPYGERDDLGFRSYRVADEEDRERAKDYAVGVSGGVEADDGR